MAFVLGLLSRTLGLPPLVGFPAAGFLLNRYGSTSGDILQKLSDVGITLLLFIVGLKLDLRTCARPQVWAVIGLHMKPGSWRMFRDIAVYSGTVPADTASDPELTQDGLIRRRRLGYWFELYYLLPMCSAIWSTPRSAMLNFPTCVSARIFANRGLLAFIRDTYATENAQANELLYRRADVANRVSAHLAAQARAEDIGFWPRRAMIASAKAAVPTFCFDTPSS